ncbi:hypothetical protein [Plantactinospora mayteni]|uniref:Uncharacterized protein n=1 Tax=Plantactinospora mayteni TaxID=566021 RepID=A0ABQ4EUC0_9ACTN|nr:hypothetical protein [Plantactinospora mayteni]GIG98259.1 hypothetical protein Pma05_48320 [Plantactinospora mayteni]
MIPRTYVKLLRDQAIRPKMQDKFIDNIGDCRIRTLQSRHNAMISHPVELVRCPLTFTGFRWVLWILAGDGERLPIVWLVGRATAGQPIRTPPGVLWWAAGITSGLAGTG